MASAYTRSYFVDPIFASAAINNDQTAFNDTDRDNWEWFTKCTVKQLCGPAYYFTLGENEKEFAQCDISSEVSDKLVELVVHAELVQLASEVTSEVQFCSEELYDEMLNVMPPLHFTPYGFGVSEPHSHTLDGFPVYAWFRRSHIGLLCVHATPGRYRSLFTEFIHKHSSK